MKLITVIALWSLMKSMVWCLKCTDKSQIKEVTDITVLATTAITIPQCGTELRIAVIKKGVYVK